MPIHLEIFHPDRIAVGIARGNISLEEYQNFLMEIVKAGILHYRKIIDTTSATSSAIGKEQLLALEARLSASTQAEKRHRGPVAIVADPARGDIARVFKEMASKDRPIEVFRSIHDARRWLREQPMTER
jgi:hypothetical protein